MKNNILAFLASLSLSLGAAAQDNPWQWNGAGNGAQDRTVVFADLVVDGLAVDAGQIGSHYLIGAFIDGECRGLAETVTSGGGRQWTQIEVFGNYARTNDSGKPVSFRLYDNDSQSEYELSSSREVVWNQATYGMPSADHVVLSVWTTPDEAFITYPATITLSKLHDVQVTFNAQRPTFNPDLVNVVIADGPHGWTAATATGEGLQWTLRGMAVGEYDYYVAYNGRRMLSETGSPTGRLVIPAEVAFANGWEWVSLFTPGPFLLTDPTTGQYRSSLSIDSQNQITEIRSQRAAIYNDPALGFFGDIDQLSAADGAYKIKSNYDEQHSAAAVLNLGTTADGAATAAMMPMVEPGFTWIGYPHEQNHSLPVLQEMLAATATEGDLIIGRDAFLEFNGIQWVGSLQTFEAGKGYIYYTENPTPFRLNWGDYYLPQEPQLLTPQPSASLPWHYDCRCFATTMPVVAMLDPSVSVQADPSRYTVAAFVGEECRGYGNAADGQHLFISLSGMPGEVMSFRLYDRLTGSTTPLKEQLGYATTAGSLNAPLLLHTTNLGIEETEGPHRSTNPSANAQYFDLRGRPVAAARGHGIYIKTTGNRTIKIIR